MFRACGSGGLPGVHSFHSGWDWLWLKPVKVNEPITCSFAPSIFLEKKSEFALRTVIIYAEGVYRNPARRSCRPLHRLEYPCRKGHASIRANIKKLSNIGSMRHAEACGVSVGPRKNPRRQSPLVGRCQSRRRTAGKSSKARFPLAKMMAWAHSVAAAAKSTRPYACPAQTSGLGLEESWTGVKELSTRSTKDDAAKGIAIPAAYDCRASVIPGSARASQLDGRRRFLKVSFNCEYRRFMFTATSNSFKGKVIKKIRAERRASCRPGNVWAKTSVAEVTAPRQSHRHPPF